MRILRITAVIVSIVIVAISAVLWVTSNDKFSEPVIKCSEESVIVGSVNITDEELLKYVTATDKQDGNLDDKIKVIRKNNLTGEGQNSIMVTFAVSDSDNNVSSIVRRLEFNDYHSPKFEFKYDFIFPSGQNYGELRNYLAVNDVIDGDLQKYVKIISSSFTNSAGTYPANIKVSNSLGDTAQLNIDVIVTDEDYFNTKIRLTEFSTYVKVGEEIDYSAKIKDVYNNTETKYGVKDIKIDSSAVDITKPGVYNVFYRIMSKEKIVTMTRLWVIVEEA